MPWPTWHTLWVRPCSTNSKESTENREIRKVLGIGTKSFKVGLQEMIWICSKVLNDSQKHAKRSANKQHENLPKMTTKIIKKKKTGGGKEGTRDFSQHLDYKVRKSSLQDQV